MKHVTRLAAIVCIVASQTKTKGGYLTECQGKEENGQVIFAEKIKLGQAATYTPFMVPGDDVIHGTILGIDAPPVPASAPSSDAKQPS